MTEVKQTQSNTALYLLIQYYLRKHRMTRAQLHDLLKDQTDPARSRPALFDFLDGTAVKHGPEIRLKFEAVFFEDDHSDAPASVQTLIAEVYPGRAHEAKPELIAPRGIIAPCINTSPGIMEDVSKAFGGVFNALRYSAQISPKPRRVKGGWDGNVVRAAVRVEAAKPEAGSPFPTFTSHYRANDTDEISEITGVVLPLESHVMFLGRDLRTNYPLVIVAPLARTIPLRRFEGVILRKLERSGVFITHIELIRAPGMDSLAELDSRIGFMPESELRAIWSEISKTDDVEEILERLRMDSAYDGKDGVLLDLKRHDKGDEPHQKPVRASAGRRKSRRASAPKAGRNRE